MCVRQAGMASCLCNLSARQAEMGDPQDKLITILLNWELQVQQEDIPGRVEHGLEEWSMGWKSGA